MLTCVMPAATRSGKFRDKVTPFVVIPICSKPSSFSWPTKSTRSFRSRGSPPVNRILSTPFWTNQLARRTTSSFDNKWDCGCNGTPFSGMQYWHRKLHRSAKEILKYECCRPNRSVSGSSGIGRASNCFMRDSKLCFEEASISSLAVLELGVCCGRWGLCRKDIGACFSRFSCLRSDSNRGRRWMISGPISGSSSHSAGLDESGLLTLDLDAWAWLPLNNRFFPREIAARRILSFNFRPQDTDWMRGKERW